MQPELVIEKLAKDHDLSHFDCRNDALSLWLSRFAWTNVQNDSARVYVAHRRDQVVIGYHALTAGSISRAEAPERIGHGLAAHPVGVVVMDASPSITGTKAKAWAHLCCRMRSCAPSRLLRQ